MRGKTAAAAALIIVLTGCSGGQKAANGENSAATPSATANAVASLPQLRPGEYEVTTKVLEFSMAGVPAAQMDLMRSGMSGEVEKPHRYCLTPAEAAEGAKRMVSRMRQGDCKTVRFDNSGNSVSGEMQCSFKGGATATSKFDGTFTSESSSMTMASDQQMPGMAGKAMHMKMKVDTHRVGECTS